MVVFTSNAESKTEAKAWDELQRLIAEVAALARSDVSLEAFYARLLDNAIRALGAAGGGVWQTSPDGSLRLIQQLNFPAIIAESSQSATRHARLLNRVLDGQGAAAIPPAGSHVDQQQHDNPTEFLLLLCPIAKDDARIGVLEVLQRPHAPPAAQQGFLRFLSGLGDVAADFHLNLERRELKHREQNWDELYQFAAAAHGDFDLKTTAFTVASEARRLLDCDRVSVLEVRGPRSRVLAVSGVDTIDPRSNPIRSLERLVNAVVAADEPFQYSDPVATTATGLPVESQNLIASNIAPEIERPLREHLDIAHARAIEVIPLRRETTGKQPRISAALVVERMDGRPWNETQRQKLKRVAKLGGSALTGAIALRRMPLSGVSRLLNKLRSESGPRLFRARTFLILLLLGGLVAVGFIPAKFTINATGELHPKVQRQVFATTDGEVSTLAVAHGQYCRAGDVVLTLQNSKLELDLRRVKGELQTAQTRLAAARAAMLGIDRSQPEAMTQFNRLTAEEEELKESIASYERQLELLRAEEEKLKVRSPIDGQVLTWDVDELLAGRPVRRGQALLTIADLKSDWDIELHVPERHAGHVLAAQAESDQPLEVSYILMSAPGVSHRGKVEDVALGTTFDDREADSILITVSMLGDAPAELRPGAPVQAKLHCGTRPLAYVWFHDAYAAFQRWVLF